MPSLLVYKPHRVPLPYLQTKSRSHCTTFSQHFFISIHFLNTSHINQHITIPELIKMFPNNAVVPPAPVLKFPIPLKPSRKALTVADGKEKPTAPPQKDQADSKPAAPKQDMDTIHGWAQSLNKIADIRELPQADRLALLEGPTAPLVADGEVIGAVPLRLIIAASSSARAKFVTTKEIPSITVGSKLSTTGLLDLIKYLETTLTKFNCFYLKGSTFERDVGMILAAESTGLGTYITNIRKFWYAYLSTKPVEEIGHEKLEVLEACMSQNKNSPMTDMLVKRLAYQWYHYQIADLAEFDAWMEQLPEMFRAMNEHITR
jgi:hypothetical protein